MPSRKWQRLGPAKSPDSITLASNPRGIYQGREGHRDWVKRENEGVVGNSIGKKLGEERRVVGNGKEDHRDERSDGRMQRLACPCLDQA